ncbi:MAG TPA: hypothetical protein VFM14_16595 [Gemmatimonadales bacterium]|nr:hypothetical protein [Gemmatimonadales bacterium]
MSSINRRSWPALVALALAGCGDDTGPLDDQQVDELGSALRDEVETSVAAFFPRGVLLPFSERQVSTAATLAPLPLCATASPPLTSSDDDIIPDSTVFTFTVPPCTYDGVRDGLVEVTGQVEIVDLTPVSTGFDYRARLGDLAYRYVSQDLRDTYTVLRNGSRVLSGNGTGLILDQSIQSQRTLAELVAQANQDWHATFTPATDGSLVVNEPLPDGTILIDGTLAWARAGESFSLDVTTATPLEYDADCVDTPQRIRRGELRGAATFNGQDGYIRLVWTDCGDEPEIRFVAATPAG